MPEKTQLAFGFHTLHLVITLICGLGLIGCGQSEPALPNWTLSLEANASSVLPGRSVGLNVTASGRSSNPESRTWRIVSGVGRLTELNGPSTSFVSPIDPKTPSVTTISVTIASTPPVTATTQIQVLAPPSGDVDFSFGETGFIHTDFTKSGSPAFNDNLSGVQFLPNGSFYAYGTTFNSTVVPAKKGIAVAKYNPDGSLDTTFGETGKAIIGLGEFDNFNQFTLQDDGKILVLGFVSRTTYSTYIGYRLNQNGSIDNSFGKNGRLVIDSTDRAVTQLKSGQVLSVTTCCFPDQNVVLKRYNTDETLDTSFGTNGQVTVNATNDLDYAEQIKLDSSGHIFVLANAVKTSSPNGRSILIKLDTNGQRSTNFGTNGVLELGPSCLPNGGNCQLGPVVVFKQIADDGKIVLAGEINKPANPNWGYLYLNANGSRNTSFGTDGKFMIADEYTLNALNTIGPVFAGNRFYIIRRIDTGDRRGSYLEQRELNGTLNLAGPDPKLRLENSKQIFAGSLSLMPNGKLLLAGTTSESLIPFDINPSPLLGGSDFAFSQLLP
jgi:uncharacterized delta-60 repeat protein